MQGEKCGGGEHQGKGCVLSVGSLLSMADCFHWGSVPWGSYENVSLNHPLGEGRGELPT